MTWGENTYSDIDTTDEDSTETSADEGTSQRRPPDEAKSMGEFFSDASAPQRQEETLICNLSMESLTPSEEKVLNYGLGFVPTLGYNAFRTQIDFFKLIHQ